MAGRRPTIVVHTRAGCGLCERAEHLARREGRRAEVQFVDVDSDEELVRRHGVRVPVVEVDGREVAAFELRPGVIRREVRRARRRR